MICIFSPILRLRLWPWRPWGQSCHKTECYYQLHFLPYPGESTFQKLTVAWECTRLFPDVGLNNILCSKRNICLFLSWAATVSHEGPEEESCSRWKLAVQLFGEGRHPCSCRIFPLGHKNQGSDYSSKYPSTAAAWQPANETGNISVRKSYSTKLKAGLKNRCPKICECILSIMDVFQSGKQKKGWK